MHAGPFVTLTDVGQLLVVRQQTSLVYKDPDEVRGYPVDWTPDLPPGATIVDSEFLPDSDELTVDSHNHDDAYTYVLLAGGVGGSRYRVVNRVTLSTTEIYDFGFTVVVNER
jgi:hypothetical protein